jgi:type IV pilus assembly protein PilC
MPMPVFTFEAVDAKGKPTSGEIEAASEQDAVNKVRGKNLLPTKVMPKRAAGASSLGGQRAKRSFSLGAGVSSKDVTTFTRQFSTLIDAGLPIVRSLDILANQQKSAMFRNALTGVREDVEGGSALSEALGKHPRIFDRLYVNMVKAGEAGGVLDTILTRLADFREKAQKLKRQIIGALIYPAAVITIAVLILIGIMLVIVPKFEEIFEDMNIPGGLPATTRFLLTIANTLGSVIGVACLIGIPVTLVITYRLIVMNPKGRFFMDNVKLYLPIFGVIIKKSSVSRFCRTLGTLIASGVPILEALTIIREATGNAVVSEAIGRVHNSIREGDTIAGPLKDSGVFDDLVVNMIDVGEETGELDKMLLKIADTYDNDVDDLVSGLMSLLEPVLIIFMGGTVGFIVIALFLPMIKLMNSMQ